MFKWLNDKIKTLNSVDSSNLNNLDKSIEKTLDKYVFKRLKNFKDSKKFIISWTSLILLIIVLLLAQNYFLSNYYQKLEPVAGGIYNEGILGTFTTANPIYATSDVDSSMARLIFSGLFKYNNSNHLVGDLASKISVNSKGTVYTVNLKPNLFWQDNQPLTSKDVVFTYQLIQNPDAQSPLFSSWQGVSVKADGPSKVIFTLKDPLASFPNQLTTGILPYHILSKVPVSELRSDSFNTTRPIGSGPFEFQSVSVSGNSPTNAIEQIYLKPFKLYVNGKAKLMQFVVNAYASKNAMIKAFESGQLNGIEGLSSVPKKIAQMNNVVVHNLILTAGVYVFFKTTSPILSDANVRTALVEAANVPSIINKLGYPTHHVNEPLLEGQLAYNPKYKEPTYNLKNANNILNQDGWILAKDGLRYKNNQPLGFNLLVSNNSEYLRVAQELKHDWSRIGVDLNVINLDQTDFNNALQTHQYDSILYGISIGTDPDVFVYWDSSQASITSTTHLNLSEYSNPAADESLEEGRTRLNPALRIIKYEGFLAAWQKDLPALGLYQPRNLYITNGPVYGITNSEINSAAGRLNNVNNWEIDESKVTDN